MAETTQKKSTAIMRPRARLIWLIGEELISDESVAVAELVKNAYDACASRVIVKFEGSDPSHPERLIITDDGIGMNLDTVLNSWLEPGTVIKRKNKIAPCGRIYQGAKGIGRFASARLAKSLYLETKTDSENEGVCALFEWENFDEESYLDDIRIDYETRRSSDLKQGTVLTLDNLRKIWNEEDYKMLHARLARLIALPVNDIADFKIELDISGYPQFSGEVQPPELVFSPVYRLEGKLDETGYFSGELSVDVQPSQDDAKNKFEKKAIKRKLGGKGVVPLCGAFELDIRAWDRDSDGLKPLSKRYGRGIQEIRNTLNDYCGASIYRDGFRVHPYGQKGNDWLNLDSRSRQKPTYNLANKQLIAAIRITHDGNPELRDRSSREGMVDNAAYAALGQWFKEILSILEEERYRHRPRNEYVSQAELLFESLDVADTVKKIRQQVGDDHPAAQLATSAEKKLKAGMERIQGTFSLLLMSAGLGQMADMLMHEIGTPLGKLNRQLDIIEKQLTKHLDEDQQKQIKPRIEPMKAWLEQIHDLRRRLEPQTPANRGRATVFNVKDEIEDNLQLYKARINKQHIKYRVFAAENLSVKMSKAGLGQILANLIDNCIFWIERHKGIGKGGEIIIHAKPLEHGFVISISDDGPGVDENDRIKIFEPYFTTKPNGMGLGLYIARLVIEPYGKLLYRDGGEVSGACFEARFEGGVGK